MSSYPQHDPGNMYASIYGFADHLKKAQGIGETIRLSQTYAGLKGLVVTGMGGSAIGGDVVLALVGSQLPLPLVVSRHYRLPNWVSKDSLVICSSYSGNTEETLAAFEEARTRGARILGITTGGELQRRLQADQLDLITIPGGLQPRAALAFSFVPLLYLLEKIGLLKGAFRSALEGTVERLQAVREVYSSTGEENPTWALAQRIYQSIPVIYGETTATGVVALRWKGQLAENAKMLAYCSDLPEMNHNEIVGWENNPDLLRSLSVIWLQDQADQERVRLRQAISWELIADHCARQETISVPGASRLERLVHLIHYGDWVSYWCALAHGSDPTPVRKIERIKSQLGKKPARK